jgi:broad specificity phosphatase PhoE
VVIWLARHGEARTVPGAACGWTDPELSDRGRAQAEEMAERLRSAPVRSVLCSDLRRAAQTAAIVARPHRLRAQATPDLRELDFGAWEGRRLSDLWVEEPVAAARWEADLRLLPESFGESFADLETRVLRVAGAIMASLPGGGDLVVVAHRGPLAILHAHLTGSSLEGSWALPFTLAGLTAVSPVAPGGKPLR